MTETEDMKTSTLVTYALITYVSATALLSTDAWYAQHWWIVLCIAAMMIVTKRWTAVVILCALTLALWRVSVIHALPTPSDTAELKTVLGIVQRSERRDDRYSLVVKVMSKKSELEAKNMCTIILASVSENYRFSFGDKITIHGSFEALDDSSYSNYLRSQGVTCTVTRPSIKMMGKGSSWHPLRALEKARVFTERTITQMLPEPDASLVIGLLTGSRGMIPKNLQDDFRTSGLTHILAISGYNITMILLILSYAFCWLPLKIRMIPCALCLIGFTLFVGASASVVRACIMGILGLLAVTSGRQQIIRLSVLWTLALMTLWNPMQLWWDGGFQLSFLALAGLTEFSHVIEPWTKRVLPNVWGIEESVRTTLAAQILTSPWILLAFGRLSVIAPVSNLLVLPAIPFAMATGAIATVIGMISTPLGSLVGLSVLPFTQWVIVNAQWIAAIPGAAFEWQAPIWFIGLIYVCLWKWSSATQKT